MKHSKLILLLSINPKTPNPKPPKPQNPKPQNSKHNNINPQSPKTPKLQNPKTIISRNLCGSEVPRKSGCPI